MTLLIEAVRPLVEKKVPIKRAEVFDNVFYLPTVWRKGDESMQKFIIRRHKDFAELREVSADTAISDDIKAHLLLRFAGISRQEKAQIIASTGNSFDLKGIESALRTQFGDVHVHRNAGKGKSYSPNFGKNGKRYSKNKSRFHAYLEETAEDESTEFSYDTAGGEDE